MTDILTLKLREQSSFLERKTLFTGQTELSVHDDQEYSSFLGFYSETIYYPEEEHDDENILKEDTKLSWKLRNKLVIVVVHLQLFVVFVNTWLL